MSWSASKVFSLFIENALADAVAYDLSGASVNTFKIALYDDDITPDRTVTLANTAYSAGVWTATGDQTGTSGSQIYHTGQWAQGGPSVVGPSLASSTGVTTFDIGTDTASGSSATMSNIYGALIYDSTVSNYGICYLYFGAVSAVTSGTVTVVYNSSGVFYVTV